MPPGISKQTGFDSCIVAAQELSPANRDEILHKLASSVFTWKDELAQSSHNAAAKNIVDVVASTEGIAPAKLWPIVKTLVFNLTGLAMMNGEWEPPFDLIVTTGQRLESPDRQLLRERLENMLEMVKQRYPDSSKEVTAASQSLTNL